jgi:glycosyltransferase involved in cell wall biosynthesis
VSLGVADHLVERWIYRLADAVTVASRELARHLSQGGRLRGQPLWIPPGANPDLIRPLAQEEARKEQGLALGRPVLCHAGFAGYDEDLLANTFVAVARRIPGVLLLTSGRAGDVLRQVLRAHGLESQWRHMGVVPYHELGSVLSCADVHLLPYRDRPINRGRFPNKLADYMASGRPVVTNPTGDLATLMEGEPFGLLAEESPEAMGSAVVGLLEHPELARAMGRRGRVLAEGRLAWSSLAEEVEQLYTDTAGPAGVEHAR